MLRKTLKRNKGITLIALVVTIIVLLILAGISIMMLAGQNGILNRAAEAKEKTGAAQEEEKEKMQSYENTINKYISNYSEENNNLPESAVGQPAGTAIKNPNSYGTNSNAQATADGEGKYFAKPKDAEYITGTVNTGVVVKIKKSEFVWVPVDDAVLDTNKVNDLPQNATSGILNGKIYTPMAVKIENNYKGILYEYSENNGYLMYAEKTNYQGDAKDYREPDIITDYDGGDEDTVSEKITIEKLTTEYNAMIESVIKYKGFYVARYEAGIDKNTNEIVFKDASIENNNVMTADASNSETRGWYGLYKKIKTFTTDDDNVVSNMIWGSQYDAMMNWMMKNGNIVWEENEEKNNNEHITGKNKKDVISNIFDLYGCHREWTMEAKDNYKRVKRGNSAYYDNFPAYRDYDTPTYENDDNSARATLYIK